MEASQDFVRFLYLMPLVFAIFGIEIKTTIFLIHIYPHEITRRKNSYHHRSE